MDTLLQQKLRQSSRSIAVAIVATLSLGLVACNQTKNVANAGSSAEVVERSANLRDVSEVSTQIGTLGQLLAAINLLNTEQALAAQQTEGSAACPSRGSQTTQVSVSRQVGSPFTNKPVNVATTRYAQCEYSRLAPSTSPNNIRVAIDGQTAAGTVEDADNGAVGFVQFGAADSPLQIQYLGDALGGPATQRYSSNTAIHLDVELRLDAQDHSASGSQQRYTSNFTGDYRLESAGGGQSRSLHGEFRGYFGASDRPFRITRDGSGLVSLQGDYGFGVGGAPRDVECVSANVSVRTASPLLPTDVEGSSPFRAGELTLTSGDTSATVAFHDNNSITITTDTRSATMNFNQAVVAALPCSGFAFTGLTFAHNHGALSP